MYANVNVNTSTSGEEVRELNRYHAPSNTSIILGIAEIGLHDKLWCMLNIDSLLVGKVSSLSA